MNVKKFLVAGVTVLIVAVAIGFYLYHKPHTDYNKEESAFVGLATDLYAEAKADHAAFLIDYRNKAVEVTGTLDHVEGGNSLLLIPGLHCHLLSSETTYTAGSEITLKGRVVGAEEDLLTGELLINLDKCVVLVE